MGTLFQKQNHKPKIFFPPLPAEIPSSESSEKYGGKRTFSLKTLVRERCPSLFKEFRPSSWWLSSGHSQTIHSVVGDFTKVDKVIYSRTYLRTTDGGTLGLDFTPVTYKSMKDDTPIVVVMHGLTGGSHESYVRAILAPLVRSKEKGGLGYRAVVVSFRGCAGVPITSQQFYSPGYTDDLRTALMYVQNTFPNAPLMGLGFSLGANVVVRYLAEEGERSKLISGCVLSCPWEIIKNSDAILSSFMGRLYSRSMGYNLLSVVKRHVQAFASSHNPSYAHPSHYVDPRHSEVVSAALEEALSYSFPKHNQFDGAFSRITGGAPPTLPFATANEYYAWGSCHHVLGDLRRPLLAINAKDDPVVPKIPVHMWKDPANEWTVLAVTNGGGHLAWFGEGEAEAEADAGVVHEEKVSLGRVKKIKRKKSKAKLRKKRSRSSSIRSESAPELPTIPASDEQEEEKVARWTTAPVLEWFQAMVENTGFTSGEASYYVDEAGWTQEIGGKRGVCYRVVDDRENIIDWTLVRTKKKGLQGL